MESYKVKLNSINTFIFDVDGVFTHNQVMLMPSGEMVRSMNTKDGFAIRSALDAGLNVVIITGGKSEAVRLRFEGLGVKHVFLGIHDKITCLNELLEKENINPDHCLYMGDDIPDYDVMKRVGLAVCPSDAVPEIKAISRYVSPYDGGHGCVRDIVEQTLKVQGTWFNTQLISG